MLDDTIHPNGENDVCIESPRIVLDIMERMSHLCAPMGLDVKGINVSYLCICGHII